MASAGGGAPGAVGGVGSSSLPPPPPPPRPRCEAPPRAVVAYGYGGDLRGTFRKVFERLYAEGYVDLVSAASCVGASSRPRPPPPRWAASPPALLALHGHGGGDLGESLREVFKWLVANGYVESVTSGVGSRPPRPPRCAAPLPTLVASGGHGGGDLRASIREVYEWLVANSYVDVASAATGVGARSPTPLHRRAAPAPRPALVASDDQGGGDLRDPLRELFERLVADASLHLAPPASTSPFRFCSINIGRFRASCLMNLSAQNLEAMLLSNHKDMAEAYYPQWQLTFNHQNPRELNVDDLSDALALYITKPKLFSQPSLVLCDIGLKSQRGNVYATTDVNSAISCLMNLNSQNLEAMLLINQKDMAEAYYPQWKSTFNLHNPRIQELNVDGPDLNAHEEEDDLSDALARFATQPKLFARPSLLLSDIGLKSRKVHVCATDLNSAIREFDHASKAKLIGSCTSAPQFCLTTDNMSGGSHFSFLHHEHGTQEVLTCLQCETSAATIQKLLHRSSVLEQKLEVLSEHYIAALQNTNIIGHDTRPLKPESVHDPVTDLKEAKSIREKSNKEASKDSAPEPAPNSDTESVGNYQEEKLMEKFNKMLVGCVFFAMPQVLIFFPKYQASEKKPAEQRLSLMAVIQHTENQSNEKIAVIFFFVIFVSVWLLGLVLSLFGRGSRCTAAVSMLTLWTVGSTVAFIDYMLCKCLREDGLVTWLFRGHFVAMCVGIAYIWFTYVRVPKFPSIQLPSFQLTYPRVPRFPSFQLPGCRLTYPRVPKFPSFQLPSCQSVFDLLRGWRRSPAPAVAHDAKAEDELKEPMLPV